MVIPFFTLKRQNYDLRKEINRAIRKVIHNSHFIMGSEVKTFEEKCCEYLGVKHAVSCASGTDALNIAIMSLAYLTNWNSKKIVAMVPDFTFIAPAEVVIRNGLKLRLYDIDISFNLNLSYTCSSLKKITRKPIHIVIPVHLFGRYFEVGRITKYINPNYIIEDCAQAFGPYVTHCVDISCFSFFPTKNLGCFGDGGMLTTNNEHIAKVATLIREHGATQKYVHDIIGLNSRLDEMQAAILNVKIEYIHGFLPRRAEIALKYNESFEGLFKRPYNYRHTYNQYTILVNEKRDKLRVYLADKGIETKIYYPLPLHKQPVIIKNYKYKIKEEDFRESEYVSQHCLSLPIFPEMTDKEVQYVIDCVKKFYEKERKK